MINDFVLIAMLLSKVSQPSHLKIVDTKNEMKVEKWSAEAQLEKVCRKARAQKSRIPRNHRRRVAALALYQRMSGKPAGKRGSRIRAESGGLREPAPESRELREPAPESGELAVTGAVSCWLSF